MIKMTRKVQVPENRHRGSEGDNLQLHHEHQFEYSFNTCIHSWIPHMYKCYTAALQNNIQKKVELESDYKVV